MNPRRRHRKFPRGECMCEVPTFFLGRDIPRSATLAAPDVYGGPKQKVVPACRAVGRLPGSIVEPKAAGFPGGSENGIISIVAQWRSRSRTDGSGGGGTLGAGTPRSCGNLGGFRIHAVSFLYFEEKTYSLSSAPECRARALWADGVRERRRRPIRAVRVRAPGRVGNPGSTTRGKGRRKLDEHFFPRRFTTLTKAVHGTGSAAMMAEAGGS